MSSVNIYTSVACNRTPESADWGKNGLILFAACNSIALFDPNHHNSSKITHTFVEHTANVNTVKWISEHEFLSGSYDGICILWNIKDLSNIQTWKLNGHEGGVIFVEAISVDGEWTIATTSLDSTIRLWQKNPETDQYETFDTISLGNGFCFALRMCILPDTADSIILAFSADDNHIYLYSDSYGTAGKYDGNNKPHRKFIKVDTLVGHENWVRGLDFVKINDKELLLASAAQDTFIRLWKISSRPFIRRTVLTNGNLFTASNEIQVEEKIFTVHTAKTKRSYSVGLESVLLGHDGWVYGVEWGKTTNNRLQLLSSSIDKTLIIWAMNEDDGVWLEKVRVGEVGGNTLGFYGGKFSPDCKSIMGHGYQGSFHLWHQQEDSDLWTPGVIIGGHFADVRDICWDPAGQYLLSVSADQTTRCHAPWIRANFNDSEITWHEIARPQVHGYDMQTVCALTRYKFASGAEEKIVRTFQAPGNFVQNIRRLCNIESDPEGETLLATLPKGASIPSLGLSNKAVYSDAAPEADRHIKDEYPENYFVPITMEVPPTEETLMQNTLWPEVQKLYGHGYEIFALCSTSDGKVLASSCRATTEEHAQIILWNTSTWKQIQKLRSHQLTVTQMKFSPNNQYLLSVSRDRRWSVFENKKASTDSDSFCNFELCATTDKKNGVHGRIIWTCDWSHDSKYFGTGSRDAKVVIWTRHDTDSNSSLGFYKSVDILELNKTDSITALSFAKDYLKEENTYLLAMGLETGIIHLYSYSNQWTHLFTIEKSWSHHLTVKKLAFRPIDNSHQLASCGEDHIVRIYELNV